MNDNTIDQDLLDMINNNDWLDALYKEANIERPRLISTEIAQLTPLPRINIDANNQQ
jgi:hypothetical protein